MILASYNVLANAYVRPDFYQGCPPAALDQKNRRRALLQRIQELKADILCLQEAEADLVKELDRPGRFFQKGEGKPDGCAILSNLMELPANSSPPGIPRRAHRHRGPLKNLCDLGVLGGLSGKDELEKRCNLAGDWTEHHYQDGSGHGALLLRLPGLTVATTHIKWDPPAARPGYGMGQIKGLLNLLDGPSIVCGDFNCESSDPIVQRCLEAGLTDAFLGVAPNQTFVKQGHPRRIDFVLFTYGLKVRALPMAALTPGQYLPNEAEPSDHLPLVVEVQGF